MEGGFDVQRTVATPPRLWKTTVNLSSFGVENFGKQGIRFATNGLLQVLC